MKTFNKIVFLAAMAIMVMSCVDKTPDYGNFASKDVDFTYRVDDDRYGLDFYVVSTVEFTNTSSKSGNVTWDFGDGTIDNPGKLTFSNIAERNTRGHQRC